MGIRRIAEKSAEKESKVLDGSTGPDGNDGPLAGLVALEIDTDVQAQYAGRILLGLGAEVLLAEPQGGSHVRQLPPFARDVGGADRSVTFEALNAGKRGVALDSGSTGDRRALLDLAGSADLVLTGPEVWARTGDALSTPVAVVCSLYGLSPSRERALAPSSPFTRYHAGGDGYFLPTSREPGLRPTAPGRLIGEAFAGTGLLVAALDGLRRARVTGERQVIDFCQQAYFITLNKMFVSQSSYYEVLLSRFTHTYPFGGNVPCGDGYVAILVLEESQWRGLCRMVGETDWLEDPRFADGVVRRANGDLIDGVLKDWCSRRGTQEVIAAGRRYDLPIGLVSTLADLRRRKSLRRRGFLRTGSTCFGEGPLMGLPFGPALPQVEIGSTAPELGEHDSVTKTRIRAPRLPKPSEQNPGEAPARPLRVLDLTWAGAGPIISWTLAMMGADVAKIEHPSRPDLLRRANRAYGWSEDDDLDGSPAFNEMNAGKRSVVVDLSTEAGRGVVMRLARRCDVLCESMRPGKLESLGLGYDMVRAINPSVVYCSLSATGRGTGEPADMPGYAPIFWAEGGGAGLSGWPEAAPDYVRSPVDMHAGSFACAGILAALERRARDGSGAYVDLSAIEAVVSTLGDVLLADALGLEDGNRHGNDRPPWIFNDVLPCAGDDRWLAVSIADGDAWAAFCELLEVDQDAPAAGQHLSDEARVSLESATKKRPSADLERELQSRGIPAARVNTLLDLISDEDLMARGYWQDVPHPVLGSQRLSGLAWRFEGATASLRDAAPLLDADTDDVLRRWLELDDTEIAELRGSLAIGGTQKSLHAQVTAAAAEAV